MRSSYCFVAATVSCARIPMRRRTRGPSCSLSADHLISRQNQSPPASTPFVVVYVLLEQRTCVCARVCGEGVANLKVLPVLPLVSHLQLLFVWAALLLLAAARTLVPTMATLRTIDGEPDESLYNNVAGLNNFDADTFNQFISIVYAFLTQSIKVPRTLRPPAAGPAHALADLTAGTVHAPAASGSPPRPWRSSRRSRRRGGST